MKTQLIIAIALLITLTTVGQQAINYKALIKDNGGNVVANQNITVQFTILQGAVNVYQETHHPTTDANGIIIINIGEGSIDSGDYNTINWESDEHFLNVQIDTGSGLTDMGTTQFMAVPYALSAGNVSGLEAIDEGNGIGWRLVGSNPDNYGDIGLNAKDLSFSNDPNEPYGATGDYSFATGRYTKASGINSFAAGFGTEAFGVSSVAIGNQTSAIGIGSTAAGVETLASGSYSIAMGYQSEANQTYAIAIGESTTSSGISSVAMGAETTASGNSSFAMGDSNNAAGISSVALGFLTSVSHDYSFAMGNTVDVSGFASSAFGYHLINDDTRSMVVGQYNDNTTTSSSLFMVGNGVSDVNRSNAFTVLANGKIMAPSLDIAEITDSKSLITKEYIETNYIGVGSENAPSGLEAINEGNGIGWRLIGRDPDDYGNIGENAVDLSFSIQDNDFSAGAQGEYALAAGNTTLASGIASVAMGWYTKAIGNTSIALGNFSFANADYSIAVGNSNQANQNYSVAIGSFTEALGVGSVALGYNTEASQNYATAIGNETLASGENSTAMGNQTIASGLNSTALGYRTEASAEGSTAIGDNTIASAEFSTAIGRYTIASAPSSTAMNLVTIADDDFSTVVGQYNDNTFSTRTLFQVGNGTNDGIHRSNAFTVLNNGYASIGSHKEEPISDFQVYHDGLGTVNGFKLQNKGANENWWRFYTVNSNGDLYLYSKAGGNSNAVGSFDDVSGAYTALSDRRVKDDFKDLYFNWKSFMQLKPLTYHYKTDKNKQSNIGFIAQDVESIYPELVNYNHEDDLYQLNYSGFGVVAIKAIQELKQENEQLKALLFKEEKISSEQSKLLQTLLDRVEALEKQAISSDIELVKN